MERFGKQAPRYRFILNPYSRERFALCPDCQDPTEQRKVPLLIHVDPHNPVAINKTCCYCPRCDLLIAHRDELEAQLAVLFQEHNPQLIGHDYLVLGTLDHDVWERGGTTPLNIPEMIDNLHDFLDVLRIQPADAEGKSLDRQPQGKPRQKGPRPGTRRSGSPSVTPRSLPKGKPGRNDPCWCGSGKKYKDCHLRQDTQ